MRIFNDAFGHRRIVFCLMGILVCAVFAGGCTPLKKKFVRQKKVDKEVDPRFIPVLDPIEYPERHESAEETYKYHYSLWKVWSKELLQNIEMDGSDKRQKYLVGQAKEQLEGMNELLSEESQKQFAGVIEDLNDVLREYERPASMRSKFSLRSKVRRHASEVRNNYSPDIVFEAAP